MPPKGKGKKGKKQDDDEYWDNVGETVAANPVASSSIKQDVKEDAKENAPVKSGGFGSLDVADLGIDEEEDFGGLMSAIKASTNKKKDKKKNKKGADPVDEAPATGADEAVTNDDTGAPKAPVEMTAEDLADEEWGPVKGKKDKGKKGKKKGAAKAEEKDEDEGEPMAVETTPTETQPAPVKAPDEADGGDDEQDEGEEGGKVLSKKEKEKLKKEKEKAKKKAQAAKKKAAATGEEPSGAPVTAAPEPEPVAPASREVEEKEDDEDDEGGGAAGGAGKKKKKKKKPAEKKEPEPKKKGGAGIAALRALMEQQKQAEEEARRKEEEEQRRLEEEEKKREEEERKKEEEKQRRKEKEKAKREQLKKDGKLLTAKQKAEKQAAEIRRQALLQSGVKIEGLQSGGAAGSTPKKVVYGNKKKKPAPGPKDSSTVASSERALSPPVQSTPASPAVAPTNATGKDDWDASSDDEPAVEAKPSAAPDVKDDWDASSGEEAPPTKSKPKVEAASTAGKANPTPAAKSAEPAKVAPSKPVPAGKASAKKPQVESSSEESEDSDSSEDSSDSSDSDSDDDSSDDSDEMTAVQRQAVKRKEEASQRRAKRMEEALAARSKENLRSPICCILGHVDTGKTKLLDKIRQTNVQEGEAGGITQQIGATYFPVDAIKQKTAVLNKDGSFDYKVPGLLVIDTPGHESFTNLRTRGSSLCNIAILVVDIMHGLEAQTLESLRLLRDKKTPFIVALNKIDRLYGWEAIPNNSFQDSLAKQKPAVQREFEHRLQTTILAFSEQGLNSVPYYENKNFAKNVSLVPTSAITGEGVPDMIMLVVKLTQERMAESLMYISELECTVLEVKVIEGLGTTIDVVLSNGYLREGDKIVVCGLNGPIVTQVRALLTPQPLREMRVKSAYVHHKEVKAALGVKISAPDLEKAIAGSRLLVVGPDDDEDELRDEIMSDLTTLLNSIDKSGRGVCVQASTLGSLEALLDFLRVSQIPVSGINIGPVHKKDVMRSASMLEKAKELACILCFDVTVDKEAEKLAEELGIRLFKADIIYHLFDAFTAYNAEIMEAKRRDAAPIAVWPCRLKILACFAKRDPIILGCDILDGTLRVGTPLCVVKTDASGKKDIISLGKVTSLEINHKSHELVKKSQVGAGVAVKIEHAVYESAKMFGRHFDDKDEVYSMVSRQSIDVLKETFRKDVSMEEWQLIKALKTKLNID
ncbi:translation initiation factor 5B [Rhizoctonia solani AG-3 Rhs1AP]|uniref:Eukaryotic translation initiation factor 5B n=2 Tax=Rhizoctonia solani AG-3 TaxID=1086053 RepID=A0A074S105_9AGAM|nr:translation initiation factor 5B [Rhizoctonia solani AG-3 Rhs1AP]KEP53031.1 translation initiation factor 5B [Rhizoctonia solani 123E]